MAERNPQTVGGEGVGDGRLSDPQGQGAVDISVGVLADPVTSGGLGDALGYNGAAQPPDRCVPVFHV